MPALSARARGAHAKNSVPVLTYPKVVGGELDTKLAYLKLNHELCVQHKSASNPCTIRH